MKIAFMSLPIHLGGASGIASMQIAPPTALYLLSGILLRADFDVHIIDPSVITEQMKKQSLSEILQFHLSGRDIVCISANTLTWPSSIIAIKQIRLIFDKHPDVGIALETRVTDWIESEASSALSVFKANKVRLAFGIESGYDSSLKQLNKGLTINAVERLLNFLCRNDLVHKSYFTFIIGFPWESSSDCIKTVEYAASIERRYGPGLVNINWLLMLPSSIWDNRIKYFLNGDDSVFDENAFEGNNAFFDVQSKTRRNGRSYVNHVIEEYENKGIVLRNP